MVRSLESFGWEQVGKARRRRHEQTPESWQGAFKRVASNAKNAERCFNFVERSDPHGS